METKMNLYGYWTGMTIAVAAVSLSFYLGTKVQKDLLTPRPCIINLSVYSYPQFEFEQAMLDNVVEYNQESDMYRWGVKTSEELAEKLVEMSQDSKWPSSIYVNKQGQKFYVPGLCYVGEIDGFGDPILYRK